MNTINGTLEQVSGELTGILSAGNGRSGTVAAGIIALIIETGEEQLQRVEEAGDVAAENAVLAESWAVGGTGARSGEDEDNAKYYAEKAAESVMPGGYAYFSVDNSTGEAVVKVASSIADDVSFAINTDNGELEVTVV